MYFQESLRLGYEIHFLDLDGRASDLKAKDGQLSRSQRTALKRTFFRRGDKKCEEEVKKNKKKTS